MAKRIIAPLLYALYRILDPLFRFHDVSVLCYHSISDAGIDTAVSPEMFEKQLAHLKEKGHTFVSTQAVVDWFTAHLSTQDVSADNKLPSAGATSLNGLQARKGARYTKGTPLPRRAVALTFDDGYADFETNALPILAKFNAPAAVFVVGDENSSRAHLGNDIPLLPHDAIERLKNNPLITMGSHGKTHAEMRHLKGAPLREEMQRPESVKYFAFAGGSYTHEAVNVAKELGYEAAFSIKPGLITKKNSALYLLQRNVILKGMSSQEVEFRTTRAVEWYARVSRWFK